MEELFAKGYKDTFKLYRRNGPCGVVNDRKFYVWGGEGDRIKAGYEFLQNDPNFSSIRESVTFPEPEPTQDSDNYCYCTIDEYDLEEGVWRHRMTRADGMEDFPLFGRGCKMVKINGNFYVFSGHNTKIQTQPDGTRQRQGTFTNVVHCLNTETFEWKRLAPVNNAHIPPPLYLCGVMSYDGKLCVFGGMTRNLRQPPGNEEPRTAAHLQDGAGCHQYGSIPDKFWTNEYFEFDTKTLEWSSPPVKNRPPPCGVVTFTRISDHHAVMFGGNYQNVRSDDLFILDLQTKEFTSTLKTGYVGSWPPRLTFHTTTCLVNPDMVDKCLIPGTPPLTQKLLIAWGKDDEQSISSDVWLLEINGHDCGSIKWRKFPPQATIQPTAWHTAQPYYIDGVQECAVVIFGGNAYVNRTEPGSARDAVNKLKILQFGVQSLKHLCLLVICPNLSKYDLSQVDHVRKEQIRKHCCPAKLDNTFPLFSVPVL
ncbi:kelch domain-containing protein 2-like [Dysidea avara]|uniref:kelch domain-containing protein 2-like n=1 Tax=Dysidea avara TaxID=196820 RepID=UPI003322B2AA